MSFINVLHSYKLIHSEECHLLIILSCNNLLVKMKVGENFRSYVGVKIIRSLDR